MRRAADQFADGGGLTGVVAAAGIVSRSSLLDIDVDEFRRVLEINVIGVQNTISAAGPHLISAAPRGSVVVLGSAAAFTGGGLMGNGAYATSKAALIGLVRGYARELAPHRVRVNMVAPGATETPMTDVLTDTDRTGSPACHCSAGCRNPRRSPPPSPSSSPLRSAPSPARSCTSTAASSSDSPLRPFHCDTNHR